MRSPIASRSSSTSVVCVMSTATHERAVAAGAELLGDQCRRRCAPSSPRSASRRRAARAASWKAGIASVPSTPTTASTATIGALSTRSTQRSPSVFFAGLAASVVRWSPGDAPDLGCRGRAQAPPLPTTGLRREPTPEQAEHRRQQRDGGGHREHDGERRGDAHQTPRNGMPTMSRPSEGDDDGEAGEHDGAARGRDGGRRRLLGIHAAGELVSMPAEDEERVVDADREADHEREHRGRGRDRGEGGGREHGAHRAAERDAARSAAAARRRAASRR